MFLSSADRLDGEDPRKCTFGRYGEISISSVGLTDYEFVTQFNNINSSNFTAYLDDGAMSYPVTIAVGTYTGATLAAAVQVAVNTAIAPATTVITFIANKFTMVSSVPLKWLANPQRDRDFAVMMGLVLDSLTLSMAGGLANLVYTDKLFITSRALTNRANISDFSSSQQVTGILGVAYLYTEQPTTEPVRTIRDITQIKYISTDPTNTIGVIDIVILDGRGLAIPDDQKNNFSYNITVAVAR
jgi:hypothetical protein